MIDLNAPWKSLSGKQITATASNFRLCSAEDQKFFLAIFQVMFPESLYRPIMPVIDVVEKYRTRGKREATRSLQAARNDLRRGHITQREFDEIKLKCVMGGADPDA